MIKATALIVLAASLFISPFAAAQCTSGGTRLCCLSLEPFSDNAYVWNNECGIQESDESILVGSFCDESSGTCPEEWYDICCESTAVCQSGVDGPVGLNCSRN
ncbi:uncharacterized protein PHACADRAFT_265737 [Phanerochaete carnosa HHB-10118-sp]|uniref:Hydrophobin n=1 Tax=Phanerochaete carnosa (strain HHB-10118-sp) TaxID=650164 RepID=K5VRK6_PHACS|nr:uncharacterized protein PHACADRAFT_265737 [Phanerochaete carnosa HHB-10118-sp]EKM49219.1 hypothetical protein PHACADRAFT_265737 [Phanerochaete carnosa HHB-10118-sp]